MKKVLLAAVEVYVEMSESEWLHRQQESLV